jgi:OmpA-OmpF porin, OOP family
VGVTQSNPETGEYEIRLPGGELYGFRAEADGHISESQNLDLRGMSKDGTIEHKDITLAPIEVARIEPDATIALNNIFFDFKKATLKSESFPELNRLVNLMKEKGTMTVEISGHADATGPDDYNMWLSEWRAQAVSNYLIQKSIEKERISVTFFGETKPADTNETKEGRKKNRRVEFKVIKM